MRRRRIWTALAILVPTVLALGVIAALLWAEEAKDRDDRHAVPGNWSLLGVRDDGRTLVVRGPEHGDCDRTSVTADESRPDRVVITSLVLEPGGDYACTSSLNGGEIFDLALETPIAGRAVAGERRKLDPRYEPGAAVEMLDHDPWVRWTGRPFPVPDRPPPGVVGLRFVDARHALCNAGFEARRPPGDRRSGMVVGQRTPVTQIPSDGPRDPTCTNGMLPAVDVEVR